MYPTCSQPSFLSFPITNSRLAFCQRENVHSHNCETDIGNRFYVSLRSSLFSLSLSLSTLSTIFPFLSPRYIASLSRVHKTRRRSFSSHHSIHGGGGTACARTHGVCNTSVKLVDTRITDRTLHSDGNREKLPSVSFARWWNIASGLLRYLVGETGCSPLQQDLFWRTFLHELYSLSMAYCD